MKKTELAKLKNQTPAELVKTLTDYREKLWQLRRDISAAKVKNVHAAKVLRRDIARIISFMQNSQVNQK